jgi:hypothetical protein
MTSMDFQTSSIYRMFKQGKPSLDLLDRVIQRINETYAS